MKPGRIVKPTVAYAKFMKIHGFTVPFDGVVLATDGKYTQVVWNNRYPLAMWVATKSLEPQVKRLNMAETTALKKEAYNADVSGK